MPNTTRTEIPAEVNNFYDRSLLLRATPLLVHTRWAQVRDIPKNSGTSTIKFRRYGNLSAATTPLSEGITPSGSQLSITDITATVLQYGDYVTVTDVVTYESKDAVLLEATDILGDQYSLTVDTLTRDILVAGTNVYYGGTATSRVTVAAGNNITAALIKKAVRLMKKNKARYLTTIVNPSTGYNSNPLRAAFVGIVSPDTVYDLEDLTGFKSVETYAKDQTRMEGEVGSLGNVRFVETPEAKVFSGAGAAAIDVHATLILGANAYGTTRISTEALKNIVKPLGSGGTSDALNQRATSGWKATFIAKILNNDFMIRLEHAVTA